VESGEWRAESMGSKSTVKMKSGRQGMGKGQDTHLSRVALGALSSLVSKILIC
jgi:hypothetical protein